MPIELGIWKLGAKPQRVSMSSIDSESRLEDALVADLSIIADDLMLIGRQVTTQQGKFIDILAMDGDGNLVVIELKRDRTPREVVAQVLDYASWVQGLGYDAIREIYAERNGGQQFEQGFDDAFGSSPPEEVNQAHELIIVASELDPSTERIIGYLNDNYGVPINAVFFRHFSQNGDDFLARTWLVDPNVAEAKSSRAVQKRGQEQWNGRDFYVGLGGDRSWEDCRRYGFVGGGGGRWYWQTLGKLFPGARVFANVPKKGYVGVGIVKEPMVRIGDFMVEVDGRRVSLLDAPLEVDAIKKCAEDDDRAERVVRVDWIKTVPVDEAYWEKGLFAIQHTACKMRSSFTIGRVSQHFGIDD